MKTPKDVNAEQRMDEVSQKACTKGEQIANLLISVNAKDAHKIILLLHRAEIRKRRKRKIKYISVIAISIMLLVVTAALLTNNTYRSAIEYSLNQ